MTYTGWYLLMMTSGPREAPTTEQIHPLSAARVAARYDVHMAAAPRILQRNGLCPAGTDGRNGR